MDPLVSILVPCFNCASFIYQTLKSAVSQIYQNIEIIVVDDGSSDDSIKIIKSFDRHNINLIKREKNGACSARNFAFANCQGDYIQFLDSDDILTPEKIEKQLMQLRTEPDGTVASGPFRNFTGRIENAMGPVLDNGCRDFMNPVDWLVEASHDKAMFPPVVWLTPRKIILEAGPWDESLSYNDDSEFFARVLLKARKIVFCEDAVSYYRRGISTSLGSRKDREARVSELESLNLVTSHMLAFEDSLRIREACASKYRKLIYSLYPENKDLIIRAQQKIDELGVEGDFNFGNGITHKIGKVVGWKNAKLIQKGYKKIRDSF